MWTHDGIWHRLTGPHCSIAVLEADPPVFDMLVNVEVTVDGRRYSASFFTPEQVRECLDRWRVTGESLPGDLFEVPDGVLVGTLSLDAIEAVVGDHVADRRGMRAPFALLDDV